MANDIFESLEYVNDLKLLVGKHETTRGKKIIAKINDCTKLQWDKPQPGLYKFYHLFKGNLYWIS